METLRQKVNAMFERYTDHARRTIALAEVEARQHHHAQLGTEHLLVALMLLEYDIPARSLRDLGVPLETARLNLEKLRLPAVTRPIAHVPFTVPAKKCLEFALREALQLGDNYIGPEHLLLGIIRHDSEAVNNVYGVYPGTVRQTAVRQMAERNGSVMTATVVPEEPTERSSADIQFDIELQEEHLRQLREELAQAVKRETGCDPSYHH